MSARAEAEAAVLRGLRERLEAIETLSAGVRHALVRMDAPAIEAATSRIETIAQEFKALAEEHARLVRSGGALRGEPAVDAARNALRETAIRLARSSAVAGGLLARMIQLSRGLLAVLGSARDGTYSPAGHASRPAAEGVRLMERV